MLVLFEGTFGARQTQRFVEEMLSAGHWSWDLRTGAMQWSRGVFELLDLEAGSLTPSYTAFEKSIHADDRNAQSDLEQMLLASIAIEREFRIVSSSGRVRWIAIKAEPIAGSSGQPTRAVGICYDVTKHRHELALLQRSEQRLRAIAKLAKAIIWVAKADGNLIEILNWRGANQPHSEQIIRLNWAELVHPADQIGFEERWAHAVAAKQALSVEHRLLESNGSYFQYWSRATPTLGSSGEIQEWIGISRNVQNVDEFFPKKSAMLTGIQIRAARAVVGWSVKELSDKAGVSSSTIRGLEELDGPIAKHDRELDAIQRELFEAGVEFTFGVGGKPGVRPR